MQRPWGRSKLDTQVSPGRPPGPEREEQRERQYKVEPGGQQGLGLVRSTAPSLREKEPQATLSREVTSASWALKGHSRTVLRTE